MNPQPSTLTRTARLVFILTASVIGFANADAHAADRSRASAADLPSFAVSYSDLDLSSQAGNRELYKRIRSAAQNVCPAVARTATMIPFQDKHCVENAVERAIKGIKSPLLAEIHANRAHPVTGG